jgi:hypothetical protein
MRKVQLPVRNENACASTHCSGRVPVKWHVKVIFSRLFF